MIGGVRLDDGEHDDVGLDPVFDGRELLKPLPRVPGTVLGFVGNDHDDEQRIVSDEAFVAGPRSSFMWGETAEMAAAICDSWKLPSVPTFATQANFASKSSSSVR